MIRHLINNTEHSIINIDKITNVSYLESLSSIENEKRYSFKKIDICNQIEISNLFDKYQPDLIMNLAAESHVDRSIDSPENFINTNIFGTYVLLEASRKYLIKQSFAKKKNFRFHHISTDEVYGDLGTTDKISNELSPYLPSSPYSASKASSDHLVNAWNRTYNLPTLISNCSNNYGPYQFPEKLIPLIIHNALKGKKIPIYGDGKQIRDWIYVEDHVKALTLVAFTGKVGQNYNIGATNELMNIEVVNIICNILDQLRPLRNGKKKYENLITYVKDRPGHDIRYALDATKIRNELGWKPEEDFKSGIRKTVEWYIENESWLNQVKKNN